MDSAASARAAPNFVEGARGMPTVGAVIAGNFLLGAQATIAVKARVTGNVAVDDGTATVWAGDRRDFPGGVKAIYAGRRASTAVRAGGAKDWSYRIRISETGPYEAETVSIRN